VPMKTTMYVYMFICLKTLYVTSKESPVQEAVAFSP